MGLRSEGVLADVGLAGPENELAGPPENGVELAKGVAGEENGDEGLTAKDTDAVEACAWCVACVACRSWSVLYIFWRSVSAGL